MTAWELRRARPEDAEACTACHRACWREAYGPLVDPALLAERLADEAGWIERTRAHIAEGPPRWPAVTHEDEVIGFATAGPSRDAVAALARRQLYAVYVRAAWHWHGVGQALLDRALPDGPAVLEVLEDNARAIAFYARNGFVPSGVRRRYAGLDAWALVLVRR